MRRGGWVEWEEDREEDREERLAQHGLSDIETPTESQVYRFGCNIGTLVRRYT